VLLLTLRRDGRASTSYGRAFLFAASRSSSLSVAPLLARPAFERRDRLEAAVAETGAREEEVEVAEGVEAPVAGLSFFDLAAAAALRFVVGFKGAEEGATEDSPRGGGTATPFLVEALVLWSSVIMIGGVVPVATTWPRWSFKVYLMLQVQGV
jgi:hypothetical protein